MKITDQLLNKGEYYEEIIDKTVFYIHHTAGGHRPDYVIQGWNADAQVVDGVKKPYPIATAFVIGGASTRDPKDTAFDGEVYRCFDEKFWAHHLGTTFPNNRVLNKISVAVEICNYGPLKKGADGRFYTYVNSVVPDNMVVTLDKPFRGYIYYQAYTDKQIASLKQLILEMKTKFPKITLKTPLLKPEGYEMNDSAKAGVSGIFTHTNVLTSKFDANPQPKLIAMLSEICQPL